MILPCSKCQGEGRIFKSKYGGNDPNSGYVHGNMRACCTYCNFAKSNRSEKDFSTG